MLLMILLVQIVLKEQLKLLIIVLLKDQMKSMTILLIKVMKVVEVRMKLMLSTLILRLLKMLLRWSMLM